MSASIHPYGGWYCPDNLYGFPPVNAAELASVPAVNGRMPKKKKRKTEYHLCILIQLNTQKPSLWI